MRDGTGAADVDLFLIDHGSRWLRRVSDGSDVELSGALRTAMFANEAHHGGDGSWYPLPDRGRPVAVARVRRGHDELDEGRRALLGVVVAHWLRRADGLEIVRRREEMSLAAELQWNLLGVHVDHTDSFSAAGVLEPAYDIAGDSFDIHCDGDGISLVTLDAMGHGLDASLSSVLCMTAVRNARWRGLDLADQVRFANQIGRERWAGDRFVTLVGVRATTERTEVVNAGHEPLRLRRADGTIEVIDLSGPPPIGIANDADLVAHSFAPLQPGECLVAVTDGLHGASAEDGGEYGDHRVDTAISDAVGPGVLRLCYSVVDDALDFASRQVVDDMTVSVVRRDR